MKPDNLKNKLHDIIKDKPSSIEVFVSQEALDSESPKEFFADLSQYGCISGMISSLIYYQDTHKFYDEHYDQIEELRIQYEDDTGCSIEVKGDLKNFFAWFAVEQVAYYLMIEMNID